VNHQAGHADPFTEFDPEHCPVCALDLSAKIEAGTEDPDGFISWPCGCRAGAESRVYKVWPCARQTRCWIFRYLLAVAAANDTPTFLRFEEEPGPTGSG
jgi:hypothetical protein